MRATLAGGAALIAVIGCGGNGEERAQPTRRFVLEDGGNTIRYSGAAPAHWRISRDLVIGGESDGASLLGTIGALAVDGAGRIYALSRETQEIVVFDSTGRQLRTIGRRGRGPGEFLDASGLDWDAAGRLHVVDPPNQRYAVFDTSGRYVAQRPRPSWHDQFPWPGLFTARGELIDLVAMPGDSLLRPVFVRFDSLMQRADTFTVPETAEHAYELRRRRQFVRAPIPFAPRASWQLTRSGDLWIGDNAGYRITKRRLAGDTIVTVMRIVASVPVGRGERQRAIAGLDWFVRQGGQVDEGLIPSLKPAFDRILTVDALGNVWVAQTRAEGDTSWVFDVFDPDGRWLADARTDFPVDPAVRIVFRGNAMYAVRVDDAGDFTVVRGRITH